jgi:hypothetical protein
MWVGAGFPYLFVCTGSLNKVSNLSATRIPSGFGDQKSRDKCVILQSLLYKIGAWGDVVVKVLRY